MDDRHMLTTTDNPYDPAVQWDEWYAYDRQAGYYTSELLARIIRSSEALSEADQDVAIENAIDEVVKENVLGLYIKIPFTKPDEIVQAA